MGEPRYINAEDAVKHLEWLTQESCRSDPVFSANWVIKFLEEFPTAKIGCTSQWIKIDDVLYYCKRCLRYHAIETNYCPDCGAKMQEDVKP